MTSRRNICKVVGIDWLTFIPKYRDALGAGFLTTKLMKSYLIIIILILCIIFVLPRQALADTRVTVYFAGGFVIGGVTVFFSLFYGGERHSSKNEKKPEDKDNYYPALQALNYQTKTFTEEDISQAGMVKILEW